MKKKFVKRLMLTALTIGVISGCGRQDELAETVVCFDTLVNTEGSIEITTEVEETMVQTKSEPEESNIYYKVENPSWDYYYENESVSGEEQTVFLEELDEIPNGISDVNQWITDNKLDFQSMPYSDENYIYNTNGYNGFDTYELQLQELFGEGRFITLDFSNYNYADDFVELERDFVFQRIIWAKAENGILYVATGHYTYAASSPHNAYITAIDLADYHVIWKTAPLTCNSLSFEVIGDAIVCGYGFTNEDDYLYILDKKTGLVQESISLKKAPDYIYRQGDILYVHTYDADLRFQITENERKE